MINRSSTSNFTCNINTINKIKKITRRLLITTTPSRFTILTIRRVSLSNHRFVDSITHFIMRQHTPVTIPQATPTTTVVNHRLLLPVFSSRMDLRVRVALLPHANQTRTTLVRLVKRHLAGPLFDRVAFSPQVVKAMLRHQVLPTPATVNDGVTTNIRIVVSLTTDTNARRRNTDRWGREARRRNSPIRSVGL